MTAIFFVEQTANGQCQMVVADRFKKRQSSHAKFGCASNLLIDNRFNTLFTIICYG